MKGFPELAKMRVLDPFRDPPDPGFHGPDQRGHYGEGHNRTIPPWGYTVLITTLITLLKALIRGIFRGSDPWNPWIWGPESWNLGFGTLDFTPPDHHGDHYELMGSMMDITWSSYPLICP